MIYYLVTRKHAYTMSAFLAEWGKTLRSPITVVAYDMLLSGEISAQSNASYIFSDLDRLGDHERRALGVLHDDLVAKCGTAHVLNDPTRSLLRFDLLRELYSRGINQFDAYRVDERVVPRRFPVFLRDERGIAYVPPPLLASATDYKATIRFLESRNVPLEHWIAIEFCDTCDADGIYRKYGAFVVGDRIVPRHVFFSRSWLVKDATLGDPAMLADEWAFMEANPHADTLREIFRLAGISYGRVDYSVRDGALQVWEINTNPILTNPEDKNPDRRAVHQRFVDLMGSALAAIDSG